MSRARAAAQPAVPALFRLLAAHLALDQDNIRAKAADLLPADHANLPPPEQSEEEPPRPGHQQRADPSAVQVDDQVVVDGLNYSNEVFIENLSNKIKLSIMNGGVLHAARGNFQVL